MSRDLSHESLSLETSAPSQADAGRRKPGRPKGGRSSQTRELILDAAELLFADRGYDGASIRDVAAEAGLQVHSIGYHFGPKESLFDAVVARRAEIMTRLRCEALNAARVQAGAQTIPVRELVRAYVSPFIKSASHGDPGWRNYAALMGRLANSPLGTEIIAKHYDDTARAFITELKRSLSGADPEDVVEGFSAMVAAMLGICAATGRPERLSGRATPRTPEDSFETLVRFHTAGFLALAIP
ncbi:TetR/AcrR family transcriptional regulator [Roseobacter sp.]|uniref:TetR/AcrR family transcriptional regulator n=1 Tax=Roseobacter sp. TaxID=1907202 RepID=UPI002966C66C|nr:TetR/AcrR family transcriptional regulator [Roseobacter sp.]MDW3183311.1 TetR/AcrR family transcriptional regulator [Roseobacter sp.]